MPLKRAPKAPPAPALSPAKKAPRPAATKKKQAAPRPAKKALYTAQELTDRQLATLLQDPSASAQSIVDFVVGPTCGLESIQNKHKGFSFANMTPFLLAVEANRLDVAQLLVAEHFANTKAVNGISCTALHIAAYKGNVEMVRWLVEQCGLDVRAVDGNGGSPLDWAINRHSEAALLLLELGADPNTHAGQRTSLHWACMRGLVDVVRALIAKGVPRDVVDAQGMTPLDIAVLNEHLEVAALLRARPHH